MPEIKQEKKQTKRYTDNELDLVKRTFKGNDDLLKAIRKVFLQLPLTPVEQTMIISGLKDKPEVVAILRKTFLPTIDGDAPFNQVVDLWMTIDVKDKSPELALPHVMAREKLIKYLDQQLNFLGGNDECNLKLADMTNFEGKNADEIYSNLLFRNTLIYHVEQQLTQIEVLSNQIDETSEQTAKRLAKDSSK